MVLEPLLDHGGEVIGLMPSRTDDPEPLGHQSLFVEVVQAGEQLAGGEIAGGAEEHQYTV